MDLSYMTPKDWQELYEKYPQAQHFMLDRSLRNELEYLRHERDASRKIVADITAKGITMKEDTFTKRLKWVEARILQLEQCFEGRE